MGFAVAEDGDKAVTTTDEVENRASYADTKMPPIPSKDTKTITIVTCMGSMWNTQDNNALIQHRDIYHGSSQK